MKQLIKKCPVPIAGLILGLAAAGNLVQSYGEIYRNVFGIISALLLILLIAKIFMFPKDVLKTLDNPVVASVFPTLSMAVMLLSTYISKSTGFIVWIAGVSLHVILILWFTNKFVFHYSIKKVFPSWFIVYVGIAVASVTAPAFKMQSIGVIAFWFGFITYLILLPVVTYRVFKIKDIPDAALPTIAIFAAPASLLLAGYMKSFAAKNISMVYFLMLLSIIMYVFVIIKLFSLLKLKFYPSYSGFTFPLVISGISIKLTNLYMIKVKHAIPLLKYLIKFQEAAAVIMVIYVSMKYVQSLLIEKPKTLNS